MKLTADKLSEWRDTLLHVSVAVDSRVPPTPRELQRFKQMKREVDDAYLVAVREENGG